ncbi:MAG: glycosyltransferase family 2 protein [Rickettsiales bacterium]|nr:glycosyltransferase family 2 protein [Rickettsiales bacterium]
MALVSIVIPVFQAEAFVARAVRSALAQTNADIEVVVSIDDRKPYEAILAKQGIADSRLRLASTGRIGAGPGAARNAGIKAAAAPIIAMLDADDEFFPDHIEKLLPKVRQYGCAITQIELLDDSTKAPLPNRAKPFISGPLPLGDALQACLHTHIPIMFDRNKCAHRFNEDVPLLEDGLFLAECFTKLNSVWYQAEHSYRYYRREGSLCNQTGAALRFLETGKNILRLIANKKILTANTEAAGIFAAFIKRNNALESAYLKAVASSAVKDYQEFLEKNLAFVHAPLEV